MTQSKRRFWEAYLSDQPKFTERFKGAEDSYPETLFRTIIGISGIKMPADDFVLEELPDFPLEEMGSNPINLRFLEFIIQISGARRIFEIGTFIGVSTMCMARRLPPDGHVVTVEKFDKFASIARKNFAANSLDGKITLVEADASEAIARLNPNDQFDLIFIDGNKDRYRDYFTELEPFLAPTGVMIVDDCFFHGDALNPLPETEKGSGVLAFLNCIAERDDFLRVVLPIANGITLLTRVRSEDPT